MTLERDCVEARTIARAKRFGGELVLFFATILLVWWSIGGKLSYVIDVCYLVV